MMTTGLTGDKQIASISSQSGPAGRKVQEVAVEGWSAAGPRGKPRKPMIPATAQIPAVIQATTANAALLAAR